MATLGGAEALDLGNVVGSIEPGKEADLVLLSLPDYATSEAQAIAAVAFSDAVTVDATWVRGRKAARLGAAGLSTATEDGVACCYARQDKVWVDGPSGEPWEIYTVLEDADDFGTSSSHADDFDATSACASVPEAQARCCS